MYSLVRFEEYSTAIDMSSFVFSHGFGARFRRKYSFVALQCELGLEILVKLFGFHLLKGNYVGVKILDLLHDGIAPIVPGQGPVGTVPVQLTGGVLVAEHIVAHNSKHVRDVRLARFRQRDPWALWGRRVGNCQVDREEKNENKTHHTMDNGHEG